MSVYNNREAEMSEDAMKATPAIDRALTDIDYLERGGFVSPVMAQRARDTVGLLFDENTVYASIGPIDDGDISFYWRAGDQSVSIDLGADGTDWASVRDGAGHQWTYNDNAVRPELRLHLRQFSAYVEAANPAWRLQPS